MMLTIRLGYFWWATLYNEYFCADKKKTLVLFNRNSITSGSCFLRETEEICVWPVWWHTGEALDVAVQWESGGVCVNLL
jgi:hypothetical protein